MTQSYIALIVMAVTIVLFATEKWPLSVTALLSALAMAVTGCIGYDDALSGFANTASLMIIGTSMISEAFLTTGLSESIGQAFLGLKWLDERKFIVLLVVTGALLSTLLNALVVMAMFMPIIDSIALETEGKISRKNTYLPLAIAAVFGGNLSVIGSTSMLNASGMLGASYYGRSMTFFEPMGLGCCGVIVITLLLALSGTRLQDRFFDFPDKMSETIGTGKESYLDQPAWKRWYVAIVLVLCIIGFIAGLDYGAVSVFGGCLVVMGGCITMKRAVQGISWETVFVVVGTLGFAKGVDASGAGTLIAESIIEHSGLLSQNPYAMCVIMLFLCTLLSNFMSNNATVGIGVPISLAMAQVFNSNPIPFVLACAVGANLSVATPICTATVTLTTCAGYRFKDYVRFGGIFNCVAFVATAVAMKLLYFL